MTAQELQALVTEALEDLKAHDIVTLDVRKLTTVTDNMVIASGTSSRHVNAVARHVIDTAKQAGFKTIGTEGLDQGEWVLIDLGDTIVHIMSADMRERYSLEKLWSENWLPQTAKERSEEREQQAS